MVATTPTRYCLQQPAILPPHPQLPARNPNSYPVLNIVVGLPEPNAPVRDESGRWIEGAKWIITLFVIAT